METVTKSGTKGGRFFRTALLTALVVIAATSLGGCFLFYPRKATVSPGTLGPGQIVGRFVDERGKGIPGVSVTIPEAGQAVSVTDQEGRFAFPGLARGVYYLQVKKEGYLAGSFGVMVASSGQTQFQTQLLGSSGRLHNDSQNVPRLCADCHVLHNPTPTSHLLNGASPNSPCFASGCHSPGGNGALVDEAVYRNSPHGPASIPNSNTKLAWTGQPDSERGNCYTCHEPHGILGPPFMLRKGIREADGTLRLNELCFECHSEAGTGNTAGWPGKTAYLSAANLHVNAVTVPPATRRSYPGTTYAMGDCDNCHLPHGRSGDPSMLRATGSALCVACHTDKTAGGGHDNCLMCHDPHVITKTGGVLNVRNPDTGSGMTAVPKEIYRNVTLISSANYCQKCHKASPPAWLNPVVPRNPFAATTQFKNSSPVWWQTDSNLHNVHVNKVYNVQYPNHAIEHYGTYGNNDRVRCGQCHGAHQTPVGRNLNPAYVTSITPPYRGTYGSSSGSAVQSKLGCGVAAGCHTCGWCHYAPGNPGASPGEACYECLDFHSDSGHSGVDY